MKTCGLAGQLLCRGWLLVIPLLVGYGCGKCPPSQEVEAPSPGLIVGHVQKTIEEMNLDDVIVAVNGHSLTRGLYDEMVENSAETFRLSAGKNNPPLVQQFIHEKKRRLLGEFIAKHFLLSEAAWRDLKPKPEHVAEMESRLAARAAKEGKTLEQFFRAQGARTNTLLREVQEQALILTLREAHFGDQLVVTDQDLADIHERTTRYNASCEATNRLIMARGQALCERIRQGEDFLAVAQKESADAEPERGLWGEEMTREEIDDPQVRQAAFTLPVGAVSAPFDTDEGLVIIKVLERTEADSAEAISPATVKLGRILLQMVETRTLPDDTVLRHEVEKERLRDLQTEWFKVLQARARIEYPNGTNLWERVTSKNLP